MKNAILMCLIGMILGGGAVVFFVSRTAVPQKVVQADSLDNRKKLIDQLTGCWIHTIVNRKGEKIPCVMEFEPNGTANNYTALSEVQLQYSIEGSGSDYLILRFSVPGHSVAANSVKFVFNPINPKTDTGPQPGFQYRTALHIVEGQGADQFRKTDPDTAAFMLTMLKREAEKNK